MNPDHSGRDFQPNVDRDANPSQQLNSLPIPQMKVDMNMMNQGGMTNNYQLYIQAPTASHMNMYYENLNDDSANKKRRTNYKNPENSAKLNAAINMLINQADDASGHKDLKSISKMFNIPYNTLRDNYLKATTGQAPKSKRKHSESSQSSHEVPHHPMPHGQMQFLPQGVPFPAMMQMQMVQQQQLQQQQQQQQQQHPHQQIQHQQQHMHQQLQQQQQKLQQHIMVGNMDPALMSHGMINSVNPGNMALQHQQSIAPLQQLPSHPQLNHHMMQQQQQQQKLQPPLPMNVLHQQQMYAQQQQMQQQQQQHHQLQQQQQQQQHPNQQIQHQQHVVNVTAQINSGVAKNNELNKSFPEDILAEESGDSLHSLDNKEEEEDEEDDDDEDEEEGNASS